MVKNALNVFLDAQRLTTIKNILYRAIISSIIFHIAQFLITLNINKSVHYNFTIHHLTKTSNNS